MKFRKHISGMKRKDGTPYTSGYDARIPEEILKETGFLVDDKLLEYEVTAQGNKIIIQKKESLD